MPSKVIEIRINDIDILRMFFLYSFVILDLRMYVVIPSIAVYVQVRLVDSLLLAVRLDFHEDIFSLKEKLQTSVITC